MVDKNTTPQDENKHVGQGPLFDVSRKVLLAAIGVVTYAQDEVEEFVIRMVERGEIAEKDGKQLIKEVMEKRDARKHEFGAASRKRMHELMERMNIPSKKEINELREKVEALTKKVEELTSK